MRDGRPQSVTVAVTTMPNDQTADRGQDQGSDQSQPAIGLALAPLSPQIRERLNLSARTQGAVVAEVQPGSPADQAGIHPGDVVVGVGTKAVGSPDEAVAAIHGAAHQAQSLALRIVRDGHAGFVALNLGNGGSNGRGPGSANDDQG